MFGPFLALHIPDGFLDIPVSLVGWLLAVMFIGIALREMRPAEREVPLIGTLAAFIFAAQMINFPVAGGTSGHLIGGTLAAILLGPWAAVIVMTCVVAIQALIFQDGGLIVMGFNLVNMAIITPFVGYAVYHWGRKLLTHSTRGWLVAAAVGAWASVVAAAAACALQLAVSGTSALKVVLPTMLGVHAVIGLGEALITVGALAFIQQTRPDLVDPEAPGPARGSSWIAAGLAVALVVTLLSPLASASPDGLERVAEDQGFLETARDAPYEIIPDYLIPAIDNEAVATIAAGVIGVAVVATVGYGTAVLRKRRDSRAAQ